jgi:aspartate/methionine/tyrosine aminotransferase
MSISQIARSIPESSTLRMNELAKRLREKGEEVIHLGSGEPKAKVPMDAVLSASAKLNSAEIRRFWIKPMKSSSWPHTG